MDDDAVFSSAEVGLCVGLTDRQLDHLVRTRKLPLRLMHENGSGKHRIWTTEEVWKAGVVADLLAQKAPLDFMPDVWSCLGDVHLKREDNRWLSLDTVTGEVRVHRAAQALAGVWWVSLGGVLGSVEHARRALLKRRK